MMNKPAFIVEHIKNNPGCIKEMYYPEDQDSVKEEHLLNPNDWRLIFKEDEDECWINDNPKVILGYWDQQCDSCTCQHTGFPEDDHPDIVAQTPQCTCINHVHSLKDNWIKCNGWCDGIQANFEGDEFCGFEEG